MAAVLLNDLRRIVRLSPDAIHDVVRDVVDSGWWLNGTRTATFCECFADYVGVEHCAAVANGSDALEIAFRALMADIGDTRREVVTVANAGGYSSIAAYLVGLTPVYADIEYDSQLASIESIISCLSGNTAFVVATHLYGGAMDVPALRRALDQAGYGHVAILEDCAQAHGARVGGKRVGSLGDIATFSFYPTKNLGAFGDAGAVVTNNSRLMAHVAALRQYGWSSKYNVETAFGRNSRMDEVQAAVLTVLLPHLDAENERRLAILERYRNAVPSAISVVRPATETVAHLAVLLVAERDDLRRHLASHSVSTEIHYPVLDADQAGWRSLSGREGPGGLPNARRSVPRLLTVPCFPGMTSQEIVQVCEALASFRT